MKKVELGLLATSASFNYRKFNNYYTALMWYNTWAKDYGGSDDRLLGLGSIAKEPFQLIK